MNGGGMLDPEARRLLAVWKAITSPLRPSPEDVKLYAECWPGEGSTVLILGATPELVDLAICKKSLRIVSMDWNKSFFPAMRNLAHQDWGEVECLPHDWRIFVPELAGKFDVVLGDGSLTMVDFPSEWEKILTVLHQYLVPGGRVMFRLSFRPERAFDLEPYLGERLSRFDAESCEADSGRKIEMLRELISEIRIAFGLASTGSVGSVDLHRRADLVRLFHEEFTKRYGHWKEWEIARVAMPPPEKVASGERSGKAVPDWKEAMCLLESSGFQTKTVHWSGTRPVPGIMRFFLAERL